MKNKFAILMVLAFLLTLVVGCSSLNPFGGRSETPKAGETKSGDPKTGETSTSDSAIESVIVEKTGVPECDDLTAYFSKIASSKDEGYIAKATREFIINRYREAIKESIEKNKENPEKMAKLCKEYKTQLETFKQDEDNKKEEN